MVYLFDFVLGLRDRGHIFSRSCHDRLEGREITREGSKMPLTFLSYFVRIERIQMSGGDVRIKKFRT